MLQLNEASDVDEEEVNEMDGEMAEAQNITYDPSIPNRHAYLGSQMSQLGGRAMLEEVISDLPLLMSWTGTPLIPGQTLPLTEFGEHRKQVLRSAVRAGGRAIGIIVRCSPNETGACLLPSSDGKKVYDIATIAEILSINDVGAEGTVAGNGNQQEDESCVKVILIGRQLIELIRLKHTFEGMWYADVALIPERAPTHSLSELVPRSVLRLLVPPALVSTPAVDLQGHPFVFPDRKGLQRLKRRRRWLAAAVSPHPYFLHRGADPQLVASDLRREMQQWLPRAAQLALSSSVSKNQSASLRVICAPGAGLQDSVEAGADPGSTSYWALQQLPMSGAKRQALLRLQHPLWRLQHQLTFIRQCSALCCANCDEEITRPVDVLGLAADGASNSFVNPAGAVHEMLTVSRVCGAVKIGSRTAEHSWFPGYAWRMLVCAVCGSHLGWHFAAESRQLRPRQFWGLTRRALRSGFRPPTNSDDPDTNERDVDVIVRAPLAQEEWEEEED